MLGAKKLDTIYKKTKKKLQRPKFSNDVMESEANYNENGWNAYSILPSIVNPVYLSEQIPIHIKIKKS